MKVENSFLMLKTKNKMVFLENNFELFLVIFTYFLRDLKKIII